MMGAFAAGELHARARSNFMQAISVAWLQLGRHAPYGHPRHHDASHVLDSTRPPHPPRARIRPRMSNVMHACCRL